MRGAWLVAIVAVAGCDKLFSIDRLPDGQPDAPQISCDTTFATAAFCADFDEDAPYVYVLGNQTSLSLMAQQATAMIVPATDAPSPPNVLELHSTGGNYGQTYHPGAMFTRMTASFDLHIEHTGTPKDIYSGLITLGTDNVPGLSSCYVSFIIDENDPASLGINEFCDTTGGAETLVRQGPLPAGWFHVDFTFDMSFPRAYVLIDGKNEVDHDWSVPAPLLTKPPMMQFGLLADDAGLQIALDNLVVTTN
jgi:hypothetical protein